MVDRFFRPFFQGIFLSALNLQSSRMFEFVFKMFTIGRNDDKVNILSSLIWWYRRFWVQMNAIMWLLIWYRMTMMWYHSRWYNVITSLIYFYLFIHLFIFSYTLSLQLFINPFDSSKIYPLIMLSLIRSIYLFTYLSFHLSIPSFNNVSIFPISQYIYSSINKFIDSSIYLFIYNHL